MRRMLAVLLAAVSITFLGAGAAEASSGTYKVSKSWRLAYVGPDRNPTIIPHIEDDVVEVRCHGTDQMRSWGINDPALNGGAWWRVDGTGIQVQPEWTGEDEVLKVTIRCRRG